MKPKDSFSSLHPAVSFLYFALVIGFSMFIMHPVCLFASCAGAFSYLLYLKVRKAVRIGVVYLLPMVLLTAIVNPAFNHEGVTILLYLPTGNPLTLESIIYGAASAAGFVSIILWFICYTEVMTSDKFIYLFGRVIPALSLILSMTLRFVPRFTAHMKQVSEARQALGYGKTGSRISRLKEAIKVLSITVTWSMENAVETADSMKSRGWGLPNRSAFSIFRFNETDKSALAWTGFCGVYLLAGSLAGGLYQRYFPTFKSVKAGAFPVSLMLIYWALCLTPLIMNLTEECKWKHMKSGT
jgi:energy-coupling factor transport system permease protein